MKDFKEIREKQIDEGVVSDESSYGPAYYTTDNQSSILFTDYGSVVITLNTARDLPELGQKTEAEMNRLRKEALKGSDKSYAKVKEATVVMGKNNIKYGKQLEKLERKFKADLIKLINTQDADNSAKIRKIK